MRLHKSATILMMLLMVCFAFTVPAMAQQSKGGHDETTEDHTLGQWAAAAAATPGASPAVAGVHLLITEVGWRGLNGAILADSTEFVEIYNPTSLPVDLSKYYLSDVNGYSALPVAGTIDVALNATDFGMRFPSGATIPAGGVKVVAVQGGWYKHLTGMDADFMLFNSPDKHGITYATTAVAMVDVATNKPVTYPTFGGFTNTAEFVWLFFWDGISDLVCDVDLVYWGTAGTPGGNFVIRKTTALCQDGPDVGVIATCYNNDAGNPAGSMAKGLVAPASGAGTRQRVTAEGVETLLGGNGCIAGGPTPVNNSTWGQVKTLYR